MTSVHPVVGSLPSTRRAIADRLRDLRAVSDWDYGYVSGLEFALAMIDNVIDIERARLPVVNAEVLGRAIAEHRQEFFEPHQHVLTHLCFDDCADDIYARCLRLIAE